MAPAAEPNDDLSVRLNWPVDPLAAEPAADAAGDEIVDVDTHLAALEATLADRDEHADIHAAVEAVTARVDHVTAEMVKVLRTLNNSLRRTRDQTIAGLDESIEKLRTDLAEWRTGMAEWRTEIAALIDEKTKQRAAFGDELAAEMKAWRRRLPTKGPTGGAISEPAMEELVGRLADEMEIRVFAALKKSGAIKKR